MRQPLTGRLYEISMTASTAGRLRLHFGHVSKVAGELKFQETILNPSAVANIVNDQWTLAIGAFMRGDQADMREISGEQTRKNVSRYVITSILGNQSFLPVAAKEDLEIADAAMIDVGVWAFQAPILWIGGKLGNHVFVHELLQIAMKRVAIGTDQDVGAYAAITGHIAAWIGNRFISRCVVGGDANLRLGCREQFRCPWPTIDGISSCGPQVKDCKTAYA